MTVDDNLFLENIKALRADIAEVRTDLGEIKNRLGNLEIGQATILAFIAHTRARPPVSH